MRLSRTVALGASMLVLFSACSSGGGSKPTIKIGSDGFDEARVVAEVYGQVLEANGYTVDRAGSASVRRKVTAAALESGQIDLKPEYIGSGTGLLRRDRLERSGQEPGGPPGQADRGRREVTVFGDTPGQDTNALVVTKATADARKLTKWSDLTAVAGDLKWGPRRPTARPTPSVLRRSRRRTGSTPPRSTSHSSTPAARRWPTPSKAGQRSTWPALLDRSRDHRQRLGPARGRQEHATGRRDRPDRQRQSPGQGR